MIPSRLVGAALAVAIVSADMLAGGRAEAALVPSADGETVHDTMLKVTWLANANLAAKEKFGVKNINPDGSMSWDTAQNWVAAMNAANYKGHSDWRLPPTPQPDPNCTQHTTIGYDHDTKQFSGGFAYKCTASDMGALFYMSLGGKKGVTVLETGSPNLRYFRNFQPYLYWSGTVYPVVGKSSWSFSFGNGFEGTNLNANAMYALPEYPDQSMPSEKPPENVGIGVEPKQEARPMLVRAHDGQMVYDRDRNITWLADANLAKTKTFGVKGINPNGSMSWTKAQTWIAHMNNANYLGHHDWRLPRTPQGDEDRDCSIHTVRLQQGSGYHCKASELGELFYRELGGVAGSTLERTHVREAELFRNFQPYLYWSEADARQSKVGAWTFSFGNGFQGTNFFSNAIYVIPVFDGEDAGSPLRPSPPKTPLDPGRAPRPAAPRPGG